MSPSNGGASRSASGYGWVVLAIYAWIAGLSQLLWLNFAPILSQVQKLYGVSETTASLLLLVFPLTYVLFSAHSGALIDRRGYRYAIGLGTVLMAVFSCLRIYTGSFWVLLIAQTGISVGQPYVVNGVTKLVADWFPPKHAVLATGLGTVGLFVGMSIGMAVTPPLVTALGLSVAMFTFAVITVLSTAAFFVLCRTRSAPQDLPSSATSVWTELRERRFVLLFLVSFIGLGYFNGLTSWIEAILAPQGMNSDQAGLVGGLMIIGGIFGSIVIPALSDKFGRRKPFLLLSVVAAALTLFPLCRGTDYHAVLFWGFLQGFFFLPAYALLLDMTAIEAGEARAGSATGVLMLTGNAGGVVAILAMGALKGESAEFPSALAFLAALLVAAIVAAAFIREAKRY